MYATYGAQVGRHRKGRPGRIWVGAMTQINKRGFFASLFHHGRHRPRKALPVRYQVPAPAPAV